MKHEEERGEVIRLDSFCPLCHEREFTERPSFAFEEDF